MSEADKRIRDPVHNLIKFSNRSPDWMLWELIQTSPFQRLRRIKQLGFSDFVYPGASHTRLSHSLGAMQVARRMLETFRNNEVIPLTEEHKLWEAGTLCAALLHDVGHGPFSHVFEEVSSSLGIKTHHEEYTLQIIESPEVQEVLSKFGSALPETTASFFKGEPGKTTYSRIISSQLDADRIDFLMRDRYHCGIHFGSIDLEWLFDSLTIQEMPVEVGSSINEFSIVVSSKGLSVTEDFLSAYFKMYSLVYFHKTTRGVQFLVQDTLLSALNDEK